MPSGSDATRYLGHFLPWDGGCLFIGRGGGSIDVHAHYAIQIAFAATPGIRFRGADAEPWVAHGATLVPSRRPHAMDVTGLGGSAVLFVEPDSREGRALVERHRLDRIAPAPADLQGALAPRLFAAWEAGDRPAMERAAQDIVRALTGPLAPIGTTDPRIARAIAHVRANLDGPLSLEDVAGVACLSPSRFRHLFVEQTGMGLRPYVLWRRLLRVWELLMAGASLSAAAHEAGFADSAHLSRTSRAMFGLAPSAMRMAGPIEAPSVAAAREVDPFVQTPGPFVQEPRRPRR